MYTGTKRNIKGIDIDHNYDPDNFAPVDLENLQRWHLLLVVDSSTSSSVRAGGSQFVN
jgi:hypothetical protein